MPDEPVPDATYRTSLYRRYVSTHTHADQHARGTSPGLQSVLRLLPDRQALDILDIGCGAGEAVAVLQAAGHRAAGVDISPEQVSVARSRGVTEVTCADLRDHLAANPQAFDVILAIDVLEHFEKVDVIPLLELIGGSLRPGGWLLARTPNGASPFAGRYRYGDFTHGLAYTTTSLRQILLSTGFGELEFEPVDPVVTGLVSAGRALVWQAFAAIMKASLIAETGVRRGHIVTQNLVVRARALPRIV